MTAAAREALGGCDVVVVTGGASVGEKDYAKAMFEPLGLELIFSKVAIKPGKPVWFGRVADVLILGLPGNPTSAYVTARLFLAPLLAGLSGCNPDDALQWRTVAVANGIGPTGPRETFHRGRCLSPRIVDLLADQDSGAQRALAEADVIVRRLAGARGLAPGETLEVLDL
jgi:molybdopterin molybdotransferase